MYRAKTRRHPQDLQVNPPAGPGMIMSWPHDCSTWTMTRMLSWLALLCRRRSTLIPETLTLRHEVTVLRWQLGPALLVPESLSVSCDLLILVEEAAGAVASLDLVDLGWCAMREPA
jgi:hypothetical protein